MSNNAPPPRPAEPLIPAEVMIALFFVGLILIGIFGGAALSGLLAGNGFHVLGVRDMSAALRGLWRTPGNPAAAWPSHAQPGSGWLTWTCIALTGTAYCVLVGVAGAEFDIRRRSRGSGALIDRHQLRRAGLDAKSAVGKAVDEFPGLARSVGWRK